MPKQNLSRIDEVWVADGGVELHDPVQRHSVPPGQLPQGVSPDHGVVQGLFLFCRGGLAPCIGLVQGPGGQRGLARAPLHLPELEGVGHIVPPGGLPQFQGGEPGVGGHPDRVDQHSRRLLIEHVGQLLEGVVGPLAHELPLSPEHPPGLSQALQIVQAEGDFMHRQFPFKGDGIHPGVVGPHEALEPHG